MHPRLLLADRRGVRRRRRRLATLQLPPLATAAFLLLVAAAFGMTWKLAVARPAEERPGTDSCSSLDLPLRHTEVVAHVSGCIAAVDVEQTFHNPYGRSIEAQYVFPLPHKAAVTDMEMHIGERVVRSHIRTREEARAIYDTARKEGRAAALLDQERPNIFTQQVANIQPGHDIRVRLRYVEDLVYEEGAYELVFPTVVGPRFIPGSPVPASRVEPAASRTPGGADQVVSPSQQGPPGSGWAPDTDRVPDASRITPPVVRPTERTGHDVMIRVELDAGVPLQDVQCASHAVDIARPAPGRATSATAPRRPGSEQGLRAALPSRRGCAQIGLLTHRDTDQADGPGYLLLHLAGPSQMSGRDARPRRSSSCSTPRGR